MNLLLFDGHRLQLVIEKWLVKDWYPWYVPVIMVVHVYGMWKGKRWGVERYVVGNVTCSATAKRTGRQLCLFCWSPVIHRRYWNPCPLWRD